VSIGAIGRSTVWFATGVILATCGWLAVQAWHGNAAPAPVLRSYDVRPELAVEIRNAVWEALRPYQVGLAPNGQLLVAAPPSYQKGVEELLKEVAARKPPATPAIRVDVWFLTASPGTPNDSLALKEVEPALRALEKSKGPAQQSWLIPVAALTCAVTTVVLAFPWSHRHQIELRVNGARLLGELSQGIALRMDDQQIVALPSGDPNVKVYWIDGRQAHGSNRRTSYVER
jgi:hypothetical protein